MPETPPRPEVVAWLRDAAERLERLAAEGITWCNEGHTLANAALYRAALRDVEAMENLRAHLAMGGWDEQGRAYNAPRGGLTALGCRNLVAVIDERASEGA